MQLRSAAVVMLAALTFAAAPAMAATKTVPASAFKPTLTLDPTKVVVYSTPIAVGIYDAAIPHYFTHFTALVTLPAGACITSYALGASETFDRATLQESVAASDPTEIATSAIAKPVVKGGETLVLSSN